MNPLKTGSHGPDVATLQRQLLAHGYSPGACDGIFGAHTYDAVLAFQRSAGLKADGVVGSQTEAALQSEPAKAAPATAVPRPIDPKPLADPAPPTVSVSDIPVDVVASMFPDTPLANIQTHLPSVLLALQAARQTALPLILTALATIRAETGDFAPLEEQTSQFNTSPGGRAFDLYDHRQDLGNLGPTDGCTFKGRGFVQLTGRANYTRFGPLVGEPDLVSEPELACDPDVAASLLAAFLKAHASEIGAALQRGDFAAARRAVNGGTHGLAQFQAAYQTGMAILGL
ncbi:peptidoglycan-binding protein [Trinickia dinghuensis]|uniref:Peptidoglycan-binding protein n=1 Tax=Trinickia dinghuensis TaxID=2291023 RepID=A0A3D8JXE4_9BURK|nr:peptidoglycan-binding protein [Trinickia dinghuensis]RDU97540.1 peptidoglycan-binding protein [Trinickia dinghuensis]